MSIGVLVVVSTEGIRPNAVTRANGMKRVHRLFAKQLRNYHPPDLPGALLVPFERNDSTALKPYRPLFALRVEQFRRK